jgi:hypothetical protein
MKKIVVVLFGLGAVLAIARAHNGPPFPIISDKRVGPCVISLWTLPDIGIGTFWVIAEPPPGGHVPADLSVKFVIQPLDNRIPERVFQGARDNSNTMVQFKVEPAFDRDEWVRVRVFLASSEGNGDASANVEITPVGLGRWDLLLYLLPFLGVGFLWFRAMTRRRRRPNSIDPPPAS